jgi:excisionase family DNA binding protein
VAKRITFEDLARKLDLILLRLENLESKIAPGSMTQEPQQVMTQAEAAKFLGVSVNSFKKHIRHKLKYRKVNRKLLFSREEVMKWLSSQRSKTHTVPRILIVEDDEQCRNMLKQFLKRHEYKVLEAKNGEEGLDVFHRKLPDLIITDILMPDKDGIDLIGEICSTHPSTKIIAISGGYNDNLLGSDHILKMAKLQGSVKAFEKPLDLNEILETIEELLA